MNCKKNKFICEESIIVILIYQKRGLVGPIEPYNKKVSCPCLI